MRYIKVATLSQVPPGTVARVQANGETIALCNVDGHFDAISDVCTHDMGPLAEGDLYGKEIQCPRHGARFDVTTGEVTELPAVEPVPTFPVRVQGDDIEVGVP